MPTRVRAVIIKDGKALALERYKGEEHFWSFPGGGVEDGETDIEALERECLEEVNVKVRVGEKVWHQDFQGESINFYNCEIVSGEVGHGDGPEYENHGKKAWGTHKPVWLPLKDLKNYDLRPNELRDKVIGIKV